MNQKTIKKGEGIPEAASTSGKEDGNELENVEKTHDLGEKDASSSAGQEKKSCKFIFK